MTDTPDSAAQPAARAPNYGFLALLRQLERQNGDTPRIGRSLRLRDEKVRLGQDPFLAFPRQDVSDADLTGPTKSVRSPILGFFGPHGALPLSTTEEVMRWVDAGDEAFVAFTDIFATRFLQLFYRAWADARPIVQFDHAVDDRFQKYLLSLAGLGTGDFRDQGEIADTFRLTYTPLFMGRVKSPRRLQQIVELYLGAETRVEELVPGWMEFERDSLSRLGQSGSTLGQDIHLGSRIQSVGEKIRIHLHTDTLERYTRLLPGGADHGALETIVQSYLGLAFDVEICLWLPKSQVPETKLGVAGAVGWMACLAPDTTASGDVCGVTYTLDFSTQTEHADWTTAA